MLPGRPIAAVEMPSGDLAVATVRDGEVLLGRFAVGERGDGPRRSDRLLRIPSATPAQDAVSLWMPPTGRDQPVLVSGRVVLGVDARSMEPRWRLNLDADGGGVAVMDRRRLLVADPPQRLTALDWEGHEAATFHLGSDVVALATGARTVALTTAGTVWEIPMTGAPQRLFQIEDGASAGAVCVGRDGWVGALVAGRLHAAGRAVDVPGATAVALLPDGSAVLPSDAGVWVVQGQSASRKAEFVSVGQAMSLASGVVVATTSSNLLVVDAEQAQMVACHAPVVMAATPSGAWIVSEDGQAVCAV